MANDVKALLDYMDGYIKPKEDTIFGEYGQVYQRTNENLTEYITDLDNKKVLCVTASGDHLLNSLLAGATEIDTFDINKFTKYVQDIKIEAIKHLDSTTALDFIEFFRPKYYNIFAYQIDPELRKFFDAYFEYVTYPNKKDIFIFPASSMRVNNYYLYPREIKERIKDLQYSYTNCDIADLPNVVKKKYDVIYLSNILNYEKDGERYFRILRSIIDLLSDDGEVFYSYIWNAENNMSNEDCFTKSETNYSSDILNKNRDIINNSTLLKIDNARNLFGTISDKDYVLSIKKKDL